MESRVDCGRKGKPREEVRTLTQGALPTEGERGCLEIAGSTTMLPTPGLSVQGSWGCWDGWP